MQAAELITELQSRGWTQVQIALRTGIPQPTISKVVRGATKDVMSRSYQKLAALHAEVQAMPQASGPTASCDVAAPAQQAA